MTDKEKLENVKQIVYNNFKYGNRGLYDCPNILGDVMTLLYSEDGLTISVCYE